MELGEHVVGDVRVHAQPLSEDVANRILFEDVPLQNTALLQKTALLKVTASSQLDVDDDLRPDTKVSPIPSFNCFLPVPLA